MINISKTHTGMFLRAVYCTIVDSIQKIITALWQLCAATMNWVVFLLTDLGLPGHEPRSWPDTWNLREWE